MSILFGKRNSLSDKVKMAFTDTKAKGDVASFVLSPFILNLLS